MHMLKLHINIIALWFVLIYSKYAYSAPELILRSFTGEDDVRIQTYTLNVDNPKAIGIFVHGSRSHFLGDFSYSEKSVENNFKAYMSSETNDTSVNNFRAEASDGTNKKPKVIGTLKVEKGYIDIYEDGTNGWELPDNIYFYDGSVLNVLNNNNFIVHGMDLRGHGRSGTTKCKFTGDTRGVIDSYRYMVKDVITYVEKIKSENVANLPVYLIGVSMGATIALNAVQKYGDEKLVDGVVMLSPMIGFLIPKWKRIVKYLRPLHHILSKLIPLYSVEKRTRVDDPNHYLNLREHDILCPDADIPYRTGFNMVLLAESVLKNVSKGNPDTEILMYHSVTDDVCYYKDTKRLFDSLGKFKKRRLVSFCGIDHYIVGLQFFRDISQYSIDWLITGDSNQDLGYRISANDGI